MAKNRRSRSTYRTVVCAVFCALGVAVLALGALIEVVDMTAAALASLLIIPILLCYGTGWALTSYAVTALLGVILMPQSLAPWLYLCLLGFYPVLRRQIMRLPRAAAFLCKLCVVTAAVFLYMLLFRLIFMQGSGSFRDTFLLGFGEPGGASWLAYVVVGLCYFTFFVFDLLIDRIILIYRYKWQKRVEKLMNK